MRFRQAMSTIARAIEAVQSIDGTHSTALCGIIRRIEHPEMWEDTGAGDSRYDEFRFRANIAKLCILAGVTNEHCAQLREHIEQATCGYSYITSAWTARREYGLTQYSDLEDQARARCEWLRTLGRTAPAKAEAHAAQ